MLIVVTEKGKKTVIHGGNIVEMEIKEREKKINIYTQIERDRKKFGSVWSLRYPINH